MKKTIKYLQDGEYHYATVKDVGDLEQLKTQHKEDLVAALNELFTTGGDSKTNGYDDLVKKVNDTRTSLNGVNSEVSNANSKINAITSNGGGRNLLIGTSDDWVTKTASGSMNVSTANDTKTSVADYHDGDKFTYSATITNNSDTNVRLEMFCCDNNGTRLTGDSYHVLSDFVAPNTTAKKVSCTIAINWNTWFVEHTLIADDGTSTSKTVQIKGEMFEAGTIAHDWSPAPEDVDSAISNVNTKIDQTANGINNTITQAKKDLQDALTQFQTFNDEIEQAKKDAETKLADAKQALKDEFNNNLADAQKANQKQLEDKVAVIQGNLDTTSNTLNDVKTQLTNAKLDYGAVNTSIQKLNDTLSTKLSSTDLDPLRTSIQSQETEIQQAKDSIATKTSKAEFDVLSGRVGNAEAKIKQQADEISLGVKKSELNGAIDNYQIEGANRLRNTIDFDIDGGYWKLDQYDIKSTADVHPYDQAHDVSALVLQKTGSAKQDVDFTNEDLGQNFVVSIWNKKDAQPQVWYGNTQLTNRQVAEIKGDYERSFFTFIPTNVNVKTIMFKYDAGTVEQLVIGEPKLELGTKPKAYAPNPNDEHKQIVDTKAELKIASDKIESTVEKQTKTDDNINQLSSRITQTEQGITATNDLITKTKDGLIKDYTGKIDASAKSLSSEFDEKTDEKIGQITDSGENLILNSAFTNETDRKDKWQNISDKVNIVADNNGLMWAHMSQTGLTADNPISLTSNYFPIKQGKITVGVDIKSDNTNGLSGAKILVLQTYNANKQRVDFTEISLENMGLTIQQLADGELHRGVYRLGNDRSDAVYMTVKAVLPRNGSIYFTNFSAKLSSIDNGGYTPNADDLKRQILNQKTKIEQNSQQITLKASSTELRDVQTIANGAVSVANQANSNSNTANTNASNAVSVANNANNNANQAKSNANSAVTTANNAKSTADNANNSASNAVNTANTANNKVTAIQANGGGVNLAKRTDKFLESTNGVAASIGGLTPEEWKQYEGKTLTFSVTIEWKNWQTYGSNRVGWELAFHVGGQTIWDKDKSPHLWINNQADGSSGKKRLSTTITVPENIDDAITGQVAYIQTHGDYFKISNLMVEEGIVAHTWSPAPEDIQTQIDQARTDIQSTLTVANNGITAATNLKTTYDNYVQKNDANIKLLGDRITNEVSKITSNGGGRNLWIGSKAFKQCDINVQPVNWNTDSDGITTAHITGTGGFYGRWQYIYAGGTDPFAIGDSATFSVEMKGSGTITIGRENDFTKAVTLTNTWTRYAVSGIVNHANSAHIMYNNSGKDCDAYVRLPMVEKGTVVHDWQPSPDDTQSQIEAVSSKIDQTATSITSTVNSTKQDLQGQIDSANTKITQTADSITEQLKSYSKTGDMQNYVNTTVQKTADGINTKVSGIESKVDSTKQDLQGQITQTANDINGKVSGVENKVDNANSKINSITSNGGGRNLWIGSKAFKQCDINVQPVNWNTDSDGITTAHITGTGGFYGRWQYIYAGGTDPFAIGDSATFSVEMKGSGTITIGRENDFTKAVTLTNTWTRYAVSGIVNHANSAHIMYNNSGKDCDAYVRLPMVEKGTVVHDWQPSPDDTQSQIEAVSSKIDQTATSITSTVNSTKQDLQGQIDSANTKITQTADSITEQLKSYSKTGDMQNYVNTTVQKTADGINTKVSGIESKVDSTKQDLQGQITQTANDINGKVSGVENKVDNANSKINSITSNGGGRNLASGTDQEYAMGYGIPNTTWQDGYAFETLPLASGVGEILPQDPHTFYYTPTQGTTYTQTIWLETDANVKDLSAVTITWWTYAGHDWQPAIIQKLGQNSYKIVSTYTWPGKTANNLRLFDIGGLGRAFDLTTGTYLKFGKLKLENGTVSHDWSPAPEDVQTQIDANKTAANNAQNTANTANSMAGNAVTNASSAVSVANNANTTANQAKSNANSANNTANSAVTTANSAVNTANNANATANSANSNASQAVTTANSANTTANQANSKVAAIQANGGGRNLLIGSDPTLNNRPSLGGVTEVDIDGVKAWHSNNANNISFNISLDANTTYTYSALIKADDAGELGFSCYGHFQVRNPNAHNQADPTHEDIPSKRDYHGINVPANQWIRIYYTFTTNDLANSSFGVYPSYANGHVYIRHLMLEKGTIAHDWQPAPEDVDAKITTNSTAIEQNKKAIALKADQTTVDQTNGTVQQLQSQLKVQADQISAKVSSTDFTTLSGSAMQNRGTVNSPDFNSLTQAGYYTITSPSNGKNYPTGSWGTLEVSGQATDINGRLNQKYVSDNNGTAYTRQYNANTKGWTAWVKVANQNDIDTLNGKITANTTSIEQNKQAIALKADQTTVDKTNGTVQQLQSQLKVQADQIASKVSSSDLDAKGYATQTYTQTQIKQTSDSWNANLTKLQNDTQTALTALSIGVEGVQAQVYNSDGSSKITQLSNLIAIKVSSSDFNNLSKSVNLQTLDSADINNMKTQGHYFVKNLANSPISGWVYVDVTGNNSDRLKQDVYQDSGYEHKSRRWFGSYWTEWTTDVNNKNVVSQINITPDQIKIASNKIEIDGNTYIHGELNVPNVKLKGNNGIVDLSGDGINITKDNGAGISIANNGIQLTANTNGQSEVEGVLTTAWNMDNKNQNGIGLILTTQQDLGSPYGGDILTIGTMPKSGLIHAAMVFDATGITSDYKRGFNWMAPHYLSGEGGVLRFPGSQDDLLLYAGNVAGSRQSNFNQPTMRLVNGQNQGSAGVQIQWDDIVPFGRITSSMSYMSAVGTDGNDGLTVSWYSWPGWYGGRKVPSLISTSPDGSHRNGGFAFYPGGEVCFWQGDFRSNFRWSGLHNEN